MEEKIQQICHNIKKELQRIFLDVFKKHDFEYLEFQQIDNKEYLTQKFKNPNEILKESLKNLALLSETSEEELEKIILEKTKNFWTEKLKELKEDNIDFLVSDDYSVFSISLDSIYDSIKINEDFVVTVLKILRKEGLPDTSDSVLKIIYSQLERSYEVLEHLFDSESIFLPLIKVDNLYIEFIKQSTKELEDFLIKKLEQ